MSNDEVVRYISTHFVPVALNLYEIREEKGAAGDAFRSVVQQKDQYQGLWVVSPKGKVLAGHQGSVATEAERYTAWPKKVLADLEVGLKAFGPVKPRSVDRSNPLPYRGAGVRADGGVTLALYDKWVLVENLDRDPPADYLGALIRDSIPLNAEKWSTLAPPKADAGTKWTVPESAARMFFPVISHPEKYFRDPKEVTSVEITGQVQKVEKAIAYLVYGGHIAGTHHGTKDENQLGKKVEGEAKLIGGAGAYAVSTGKMLSLTLVFHGRTHELRYGAVVEWRREQTKP